jgi:hypothetical protein
MAEQGYGQQDPSDSSSEYNKDVFIIRQIMSQMSTAKIVLVKAVDKSAKTVDLQPMVKQLDGQGNATSHGVINAVPYFGGSQAGLNAVMMDPVVGDKGLMICCDRDISSVIATKAEATPGSYRKHSAADGVYVGGLMGINDTPTQSVKFTDTGIEIADKNNNKLVSSSTGWEFTGPVKFNGAVTGAGMTLSGTITANAGTFGGKSFATHTHNYISPNTPYTGAVVPTGAPL